MLGIAKGQATRHLVKAQLEKFDSDGPRDEQGRWTDGGGSSGGSGGEGGKPDASEHGPIGGHPGAASPAYTHRSPGSSERGRNVAAVKTGIAEHISALEFLIKYDRGYHRGFDPNEPRDESGKWTDGGGGGESGASDKPAAEAEPVKLDPKVVEVGGDEWNKATARRLEREYQQAKPKLDEIVDKAVGKDVEEPTEEEDEPEEPYVPESWDELSTDVQDQAGEQYAEKEYDNYLQSEKENWYDNGEALDQAKAEVVENYMSNSKTDWVKETIEDYRADSDARIPYTTEQLMDAISMEYDSGNQGTGDFTLNFNDDKLQRPSNLPPPEQGTLPGIEPLKPHEQLTEGMRDGLTKAIEKAFDKEAGNWSGTLDPPDYLSDSAQEFAQEIWSSSLSDKQKFEWIKNNTNLIEDNTESNTKPDAPTAGYWHIDALPKTYDPLNNTSGTDYQRTQALARYLSIERAKQVLLDRNLVKDDGSLREKVVRLDQSLWSEWKGSSTSTMGQLLQLATADELNGRLRTAHLAGREELERFAGLNEKTKAVGGYAGVKAYVRAKWETTQYLLDKAQAPDLTLYRGISLPSDVLEKWYAAVKQHVEQVSGYKALPKIQIERNGAASTTVDPSVANGWSNDATRVVLRGQFPRTAVISVPAYGINIHSEKEVVVAGTAWKSWDAWKGKAPPPEQIPMLHAA